MFRKKPPKKKKARWIKMTFLHHVSTDDKVSCFASFRKDILQTNLVYKQATGFCLKH